VTQGDTTHQESTVTDKSADEMLDAMYRDLVQIHMAIASRTTSDKEIIPWTERELMGLIRELGAFRRSRRATADAG
jgi:hypothetical protein